MADITWPDSLKATAGKSKVMAATIGGGRSFSGLEQVVANDAGWWRLTMSGIIIRSNPDILEWNRIEAVLQGRSGTALVPFLDCHRAPWPVIDGETIYLPGKIPHSDGALFSDGSGYYQPTIVSEAEGAIAAGATSGQIRMGQGSSLAAGMHFSAGERGYRIKSITATEADGDETLYTVTFWPPAREAIAAGASLDFEHPKFRARLATDEEMDFDPELLRYGRPTLNWVEDV